MDIYWELAGRMYGILVIIMNGLLYGRFITPFLRNGNAVRPAKTVYICVMSALYLIPYTLHGFLAYALGVLAFFAVIFLYDRRNMEQKIFLFFFLYLAEWISHGVSFIPRELLYQGTIRLGPAMKFSESVYFLVFLLTESCFVLCRYAVMRMLLNWMGRIYIYKNENMSRKELGLMLAIPISVIIGYFAFVFFSDIYLEDTDWYIQDTHASFGWVVALYQIISYAALVAMVVFYQDMKKNNRKERENAVLAGQLKSLQKHIGEVEALYRDIRGMRHDMGNHIMMLESLCQKDRQKEAIDYLEKLKEQFHEAETEIKSGNPVTDILLTESKKEAERRGICFACDFYYPEGVSVNAFDVSIILNNALNNAIEGAAACALPEAEPFIRISSYREKNAYMIEVMNSLKERVLLEEENGLPVTTKEDNGEHGYGLNNIRRVAQKYFGDIAIEQKDGTFLLQVMLIIG